MSLTDVAVQFLHIASEGVGMSWDSTGVIRSGRRLCMGDHPIPVAVPADLALKANCPRAKIAAPWWPTRELATMCLVPVALELDMPELE